MLRSLLSFAFLTILIFENFAQQVSSFKPFISFEETVTYKMMEMDAVEVGDNRKEIEILKALMEKAVYRIATNHLQGILASQVTDSLTAASTLQAIDSTQRTRVF